MPKRDEEEYAERRQQIIRGALSVFSQKGFEKTTNKDIARAAGIGSPGLIYHYFKDKADLFREVVESRAPVMRILAAADQMMERPPRELLHTFGTAFLATMADREGAAQFRLLLGEAMHRPSVAHILNELGPARALNFLSRYLKAQMDAGRLRPTDPRTAARCFVGPLIAYILTREILIQPDSATLTPEQMIDVTVDIFLRGLGQSPDGPRSGSDE